MVEGNSLAEQHLRQLQPNTTTGLGGLHE